MKTARQMILAPALSRFCLMRLLQASSGVFCGILLCGSLLHGREPSQATVADFNGPGSSELFSKSAGGTTYVIDGAAADRLEAFRSATEQLLQMEVEKAAAGKSSALIDQKVLGLVNKFPSRDTLRVCAQGIAVRQPGVVAIYNSLDAYPCCKILLAAQSESVPVLFEYLFQASKQDVSDKSIQLVAFVLRSNFARETVSQEVRMNDLLVSLERHAIRRNAQSPDSYQNFERVAEAVRMMQKR